MRFHPSTHSVRSNNSGSGNSVLFIDFRAKRRSLVPFLIWETVLLTLVVRQLMRGLHFFDVIEKKGKK